MKTNKFGVCFKALLLATSLLFIACGENNTSGRNNRNNGSNIWGIQGGVLGGGNALNTISAENPCYEGGQRVMTSSVVQTNANVGAQYVGVSSYGDIAVIQGNQLNLYICPRAGLMNGNGNIIQQPIVNNSFTCPIGEISAMDIVLYGQGLQFPVAFAPIHIPQYGRHSSLCTQWNQNYAW